MSQLAKLQNTLIKARRHEAELAARIQKTQKSQLVALPKSLGLSTIDELIKALLPYASPKMKGRFKGRDGRSAVSVKAAKTSSPRKRKYTKITEETRAQVKALVKAGQSGVEIATRLGISLPSVQNIKTAAGLVNKRR